MMQAERQATQKNTAAAPAPKPGQAVKPGAPTAKPGTPAKPKKKVSGGVVLAIFLIVAMIAGGAVVYLNVGGLRQKLVDVLKMEDAAAAGENAAVDAAQLEQKQKDLDAKSVDLETQAAALKDKTQKLKDKEKELTDRETALKTREDAVASTQANIDQTKQTQDDLAATAKVFESMEPAVAATAISGFQSVDDMVTLLLAMPSETAAGIIGNMDAKLATQVLSAMMK